MLKKAILLLSVIVGAMAHLARGQSYTIQSFEGDKATIRLYYKPASGMLTISCLKDTLKVDGYSSLDYVNVLGKVFLQVNYIKIGGSNEGFGRQLLLYVSNGRLGQALHVESYSNYDMRPAEYSLFNLRATLTGADMDTYKLTLRIHDESRSKRDPASNHRFDTTGLLAFDKKNKCFYSRFERMAGTYTFHGLYRHTEKRRLEKDVPVVVIENDTYYFIDGEWFSRNKDHFLSERL